VKPEAKLYFNPSCSKCRAAGSLLGDRGVEVEVVRYLDEAPSVDDLRALAGMLGIADPREMMRTGEALYAELGLDTADSERLLAAIAEHPVLLERPIFVKGGRAVVARPPDRLLELL
jgi:arsenate reductase